MKITPISSIYHIRKDPQRPPYQNQYSKKENETSQNKGVRPKSEEGLDRLLDTTA